VTYFFDSDSLFRNKLVRRALAGPNIGGVPKACGYRRFGRSLLDTLARRDVVSTLVLLRYEKHKFPDVLYAPQNSMLIECTIIPTKGF